MIKHIQISDINYGSRRITSNAIVKSDGSIYWEPTLFLFQRANNDGLKANSIDSYAQDLVTFLNVVNTSSGDLNWKVLTDQQMTTYIHSYLQKEKKVKVTTVKRHIATLKSFYDWAWEINIIDQPSCFTFGYSNDLLKGEPVSLSTNYIYKDDFIELNGSVDLKGSFVLERDELILAFGYYTGVRAEEIVDPRNFKTVTLRKILYEAKDENRLTLDVEITGKGNKLRTIVIPPVLFQALENFLLGRRKKYPDGSLICKKDGLSLNRQHASTVFSNAVSNSSDEVRVRLTSLSYHSLRHTFATNLVTWCYENNRDPWHLVQERMGHENKETTLNYVAWEAYLNNRIDVVGKLSLGENTKYKKVNK